MELNFSKIITDSGIPLWILPMPAAKSVAAGVLVRAGTRDEIWPKEAGIAHALEHMHSQGTTNFPNKLKLSEYIEEVGGYRNAWTWKEMTFYYNQVPAGYADRSVNILSEQLNKALIPKEKIQTEMQNIVQEIRRAYDDPKSFIGRTADKFIYRNHPLARDTLGFEESVLALKRDDFLKFKKRYYNSSNYIFIVAGNITKEEVLKIFNNYFPEELKSKPNIRNEQGAEFIGENKKLIEKRDVKQVHMFLNATIGKARDKDAKLIEIFTNMISGGSSFPLFEEVRNKRGLCYEIWAREIKWSDVGMFKIYIGADSKRYKEAINATLEVIEKSKSDEQLLEKAKKFKIGRLALQYENTMDIINAAAEDIAFTGVPKSYDQFKHDIEQISIKDIQGAVDKYLKSEMIFRIMLVPNDFQE